MLLPWTHNLRDILNGHPTLGGLVELCEENYRNLLKLAPSLRAMDGQYLSRCAGHADLHLEVIERSRYTLTVHLTYYFEHHESGVEPDPDALLRVYFDAEQVEVMDLRQSSLPLQRLYESPALLNKWQANLFVAKWLDFCVHQGHVFWLEDLAEETAAAEV